MEDPLCLLLGESNERRHLSTKIMEAVKQTNKQIEGRGLAQMSELGMELYQSCEWQETVTLGCKAPFQ